MDNCDSNIDIHTYLDKIDNIRSKGLDPQIPHHLIEYHLTSYEVCKVIGTRATALSYGALPTVDYTGLVDPLAIACKEFTLGKLPMIIVRDGPRGGSTKIRIKLSV